jgi:UDP-N-acetylglucosamine--N-acetylmuramyl-(pentapeptide) pyrophosphoryl-undecaprenol N-acetylglucosamine transferase
LYPGIAVAREMLARQPSAAISFAGTTHGIEARVIPRHGNGWRGLEYRLLNGLLRATSEARRQLADD